MAKNELIEATVAKRKSVDVDGVMYGPGKTVNLPAAEVRDLINKGFLVDPAGSLEPDNDASGVAIEGQQ